MIEGDVEIDRLELEIDDLCLELLARQQPMAGDLRFITTAMKITPIWSGSPTTRSTSASGPWS